MHIVEKWLTKSWNPLFLGQFTQGRAVSRYENPKCKVACFCPLVNQNSISCQKDTKTEYKKSIDLPKESNETGKCQASTDFANP